MTEDCTLLDFKVVPNRTNSRKNTHIVRVTNKKQQMFLNQMKISNVFDILRQEG